MSSQGLSESENLESLKGHRLGPYLSHNPVSATQIWQWCSAMGDNNPCYHPGENQIAPPAMMQMWTMRDINDRYAPGSTAVPPYQVFDDLQAIGYPANVAVSYDIQFHRYLRVGDRAKHFTTVVNISDKKSTRLGTGYFVTERVEYLTNEETLFAEALITYFQYQPAQDSAQVESVEHSETTRQTAPAELLLDASAIAQQPDFTDIDLTSLRVGDRLPELRIAITHKLVVGGAIATQDFIPVHHNLPAARAAGMPDIFMNILTTSGLSARYLSDWAGAGSRLKQVKFNLMAPNFPGDVMVMSGEVTAIETARVLSSVAVAFSGSNRQGYHTSGTATLLVPNSHMPE
jgi:acyl dehydratase